MNTCHNLAALLAVALALAELVSSGRIHEDKPGNVVHTPEKGWVTCQGFLDEYQDAFCDHGAFMKTSCCAMWFDKCKTECGPSDEPAPTVKVTTISYSTDSNGNTGVPCDIGWVEYPDGCYKAYTEFPGMTWKDANQKCKQDNAILPDVRTPEDNAVIQKVVVSVWPIELPCGCNCAKKQGCDNCDCKFEYIWMNAKRNTTDGPMYWTDTGEELSWTNWWTDLGMPRTGRKDPDCLAMQTGGEYKGGSGKWVDILMCERQGFESKLPFICTKKANKDPRNQICLSTNVKEHTNRWCAETCFDDLADLGVSVNSNCPLDKCQCQNSEMASRALRLKVSPVAWIVLLTMMTVF